MRGHGVHTLTLGILLGGGWGCGADSSVSTANAGATSGGQQSSSNTAGGSAGGAHSAGSSSAGSRSGGASSGGSPDAGPASDGGVNAAGQGGESSLPDAGNGGEGTGYAYCDVVYPGPPQLPRMDGPENISCETVTDEILLARYDDLGAKVPQGAYWESSLNEVSWPSVIWAETCSDSAAQVSNEGNSQDLGELEAEFATPWFYETSYCGENNVRRVYRSLRCDYFDGTTLSENTGEALSFLASLLWWKDNGFMHGNVLLGHSVTVGNATEWVQTCSLRTVFGDFGLCDEITLETSPHLVRFDGEVMLGEPEVVRTIQGDCH